MGLYTGSVRIVIRVVSGVVMSGCFDNVSWDLSAKP